MLIIFHNAHFQLHNSLSGQFMNVTKWKLVIDFDFIVIQKSNKRVPNGFCFQFFGFVKNDCQLSLKVHKFPAIFDFRIPSELRENYPWNYVSLCHLNSTLHPSARRNSLCNWWTFKDVIYPAGERKFSNLLPHCKNALKRIINISLLTMFLNIFIKKLNGTRE